MALAVLSPWPTTPAALTLPRGPVLGKPWARNCGSGHDPDDPTSPQSRLSDGRVDALGGTAVQRLSSAYAPSPRHKPVRRTRPTIRLAGWLQNDARKFGDIGSDRRRRHHVYVAPDDRQKRASAKWRDGPIEFVASTAGPDPRGSRVMRWPWSRSVERRASYTDALVGAVFAQAAGTSTTAAATAALEAAAGAVARGFSQRRQSRMRHRCSRG